MGIVRLAALALLLAGCDTVVVHKPRPTYYHYSPPIYYQNLPRYHYHYGPYYRYAPTPWYYRY